MFNVWLSYMKNCKYHKAVMQSITGAEKQHYYTWEVYCTSRNTFPLELA